MNNLYKLLDLFDESNDSEVWVSKHLKTLKVQKPDIKDVTNTLKSIWAGKKTILYTANVKKYLDDLMALSDDATFLQK